MSNATAPRPSGRSGSAGGTIARLVGVLGAAVCLALALAVVLGRGRLIDRVDEIAGKIDGGVATGVRLFVTTSERVGVASARVQALGDAVRARAAEAEPASERAQALQERTAEMSDRYQAMRVSYVEARERAVSALERLNALDAAVPAITIPAGPVEALAALDEKARALDADVLALLEALRGVGSGAAAMAVAAKVDLTAAAIEALSTRLGDATTQLDELRARLATRVDAAKSTITWTSIAAVLVCLYVAFLHVVLYRSGGCARRESEDASGAGPVGAAP